MKIIISDIKVMKLKSVKHLNQGVEIKEADERDYSAAIDLIVDRFKTDGFVANIKLEKGSE